MRCLFFFILFLFAACDRERKTDQESDVYYTCSMDPQVVESKPGICPICKMDLTPVKKSKRNNEEGVELSDQQIRLGNIQWDTIRNRLLGSQDVLTATLNFDQTRAVSVSARVMGRVEKLYYRNVGDFVRRGSPVYEIYSEDLNNAKQEYILALERRSAFPVETVIDFDQLISSAKNKLLLWGLSETQIGDLARTRKSDLTTLVYSKEQGYITSLEIREGDYLMEGGTVMKLADLSYLWAEAQIFASQLSQLNQNSTAIVLIPELNGRELRGRIEFVNPELSAGTRLNLIRVSIPNPGSQLKPGMPAYMILKSPERRTLSLPIDAVVRDGKGATAWVKSGTNTFRPVMVRIGSEMGDRIEVISGLNEGDVVVTSGTYLLHSEYVFRKGIDPMSGHNH